MNFGLPSSVTNVTVGFFLRASSFCNVLFACFVLVLTPSLHRFTLSLRYIAVSSPLHLEAVSSFVVHSIKRVNNSECWCLFCRCGHYSSFKQCFFVFFGNLQARISQMICVSSTIVSSPSMPIVPLTVCKHEITKQYFF